MIDRSDSFAVETKPFFLISFKAKAYFLIDSRQDEEGRFGIQTGLGKDVEPEELPRSGLAFD